MAEKIPVWTTVTVGTFATSDALLQAVHESGCTTTVSSTEMIRSMRLQNTRQKVHVTCVTVKDLGLPKGTPYGRIRLTVQDYGCVQCLPEVGPLLRAQYLTQPGGQRLIVAMSPMLMLDENMLFSVQYYPDEDPLAGFCLDAVSCGGDDVFYDDDILVFTVPEKYV